MVELLDDTSPTVVEAVKRALIAADRRADVPLRRAAESELPRLRVRARQTLLTRERRATIRRLLGYVMRDDLDFERALFVLGGLDRPGLDRRPYVRALDAMAAAVRDKITAANDPGTAPLALAEVLGDRMGFVGSEVDYDHPDNIHLHRAIERKRGMPLTLVAIYLFVARRAGIRAAAVPLPGHVMCRLYANDRAYLVDPFHGGKLRTREDCVRYLALHELVPRAAWFRDAADRDLFQRHVRNMMRSFDVRGRQDEARGLLEVARTLGRHG
ncbi:MAG: transglutaminase family protein [Planctomycetota bacterium]